jgi:hypothetical protein
MIDYEHRDREFENYKQTFNIVRSASSTVLQSHQNNSLDKLTVITVPYINNSTATFSKNSYRTIYTYRCFK